MTADSKGRELFIVDNSVSGWTGLRYLEEWASIAKAFDIATGYFEIGALLALDGKWQELEKIRILMGAETTHRTRKAILEAVRKQALDRLNDSIEEDKKPNPFLHGVPAILDALSSGQIECRVYDKDKFHAKTYITHAKLEVVGAQALVGSSNFTRPGLSKNVELNVQVQSAREVAQLQEWFETHWNEASEVTEAVIETISHHTHLYSPFDVYAKALQQFFRGHELTATEWDETRSRMFQHLDRYQKEAYWALMKIARQHGGAFLCDGVGLGKTFVGLMLIERLILHEGKRVALFAPKAAKEAVWEPHLRRWLPHIGGVGGGADFSNLAVFSHTDLGREGDFPERFRRIAELADVVVIDEAHHFRNPGRRGDPERGIEPSRYHRLFELLDNAERPKDRVHADGHTHQQPPERLPPHDRALHPSRRGLLRTHHRREPPARALQPDGKDSSEPRGAGRGGCRRAHDRDPGDPLHRRDLPPTRRPAEPLVCTREPDSRIWQCNRLP